MNCEDAQVESIMRMICDDHPDLKRARERLRRAGKPKLAFSAEFLASFRRRLAAQETK